LLRIAREHVIHRVQFVVRERQMISHVFACILREVRIDVSLRYRVFQDGKTSGGIAPAMFEVKSN